MEAQGFTIERLENPGGNASRILAMLDHIRRTEFGMNPPEGIDGCIERADTFYRNCEEIDFWCAKDAKDEVAGCIGLKVWEDKIGELRKFFIRADCRGSGLSKALLKVLLERCQALGLENLYLGTTALFKAAHRFYEKNGFVRVNPEDYPEVVPLCVVDAVFYRYNSF